MVETGNGKEYPLLRGSEFDNVRATLHSKKWFAFDLDDTLHDFRAASDAALEAILANIHRRYGADVDEMRKAYRTVLAEKTSSAFVNGRTSREYRRERFEALLEKGRLSHDSDYQEHLADLYQDALSQSLRLKPGAMELLKLLKSMDKKVIIIIEGPEDAQLWTIRQLGIHDKTDIVATTNRFEVSKVDGLLEKVMQAYRISATNLVCIGDNVDRDIKPAVQANVYAIHYAEDEDVYLSSTSTRVNAHHQIISLIGDVLAVDH